VANHDTVRISSRSTNGRAALKFSPPSDFETVKPPSLRPIQAQRRRFGQLKQLSTTTLQSDRGQSGTS
jgi:hypothetical protein